MDEGAGTFKFIKIKKFIRGNSEWKKYIYIYIPPAGFSYLRGEENGELGCGDGSGGGGKGRR